MKRASRAQFAAALQARHFIVMVHEPPSGRRNME